MLREIFFSESVKALAGDGSPVPNYALTGNTARRLSGAKARSNLQAYGGDNAIDWVMDCVDLYGQTASNAKYYFAEPSDPAKTGTTTKPVPVENPPQDLVNLFNRPNPYMDYTEMMELSMIDYLVAGEFFWLKFKRGTDPNSDQFGKPLGLYRLSPALVEIKLDDNDRPEKVVWTAPGTGTPVEFKPEDVVHVKRPNPHNQWRGMSVLAASPMALDLELAVVEAMANYYQNGTRPSGSLESDRTVPPSTWTKIKRQFRQLYSGSANAGSVIMLEKGIRWTAMSANATDANYENISDLSMRRIAKMFKVPLKLLGEESQSRAAGGAGAREPQRIFDNQIMRPVLNRFQSQITYQLVEAWNLEFYIDHEYVMTAEDKLDLGQAKASLPGIIVKEVRAQIDLEPLENNPDIKNGKEIDNTVLNLPGENLTTGRAAPGQGFPDRGLNPGGPLDGEGGRPPNGENTKAFPKSGPLPAGSSAVQATKKSLDAMESAANIRQVIRAATRRLQEVK